MFPLKPRKLLTVIGLLTVLPLTPVAFAATQKAARLATGQYKTVTLQGVWSDNGRVYDVKTVVPKEVQNLRTVVRKPAFPGAAIILDKVGLAAAVDTKSSSAEGFLEATAPRVTHIRSVGHGIWFGQTIDDPTDGVVYEYAVSLGKNLNFSLTLPGITATQNHKLAPIIETILEHAKYVGEAK